MKLDGEKRFTRLKGSEGGGRWRRIKALRCIKSMRDHASIAFSKQYFSWPYQPSSSLQHVVTSVILKKAVMISRSIFLQQQHTL